MSSPHKAGCPFFNYGDKMKQIKFSEEDWREGYEQGWDNGFKACLIYLIETLPEELIKRKKLNERKNLPVGVRLK